MISKLINIGNVFFLGIAFFITVILPYKLIYLSKIIAVYTLIISLLILIILTVKNSIKVQIRFSYSSAILLFILILDIFLFYRVNKFLAICILTLVILSLILDIINLKNITNSIKAQIRLSLLSIILLFIFVMDNGFFYRVNADIVYQDQNVFIVDKNEPTAIMSCGTVFTLFIKKKWGYKGYEVIPNKYCFTELPEIELNDDKKVYTFLLTPNGYVHGTIIFQLESEEIIFNIKSVRDID